MIPKAIKVGKIDGRTETARKKVKNGIYLTLSIILDKSLTSAFFSMPVKNVMIINFLHKYK